MAYVIQGDHLLLLTVGLQLLGIVIPYSIVFNRDIFYPPIPFISQTIAFSPETGFFSLFLSLGSFFGIFTSVLITITSNHREKGFLYLIKGVSAFSSILYFVSWILIVSTPLTYTDVSSKYEWITSVLIIHMVGALSMLSSCTCFVCSQVALNWNLPKEYHNFKRKSLYINFLASSIGLPSLVALGNEELSSGGASPKEIYYSLPTQLSVKYIATSICEWTIIFSMWTTLLTFYNDLRQVKIRLEVKTTDSN